MHTILVESTMDEKPFSERGDSGSLVTLSRNPGDKTHARGSGNGAWWWKTGRGKGILYF